MQYRKSVFKFHRNYVIPAHVKVPKQRPYRKQRKIYMKATSVYFGINGSSGFNFSEEKLFTCCSLSADYRSHFACIIVIFVLDR